jgi:membrane-associated phospholipid phosphatase
MPSTHSTALSFYFFYLIPIILSTSSSPGTDSTGLSSFVSHRINIPALGPVNLQNVFHSTPFAVFVASYWLGGVWSRVKLGYHTYPQVFGGMLLGGLLAAGWRGTWEGSELVRGTVGSLVGWGMRLLIRSLGAIGVEGRLKDL